MIRILFAVHGYEPAGWVQRVLRALPPTGATGALAARVLVVLDVPSPSLTSLVPGARRWHAAARAEWLRQAEARAEPAVTALAAALPVPPEVERVVAANGDPGRAIVEHARRWGAGLVVVGRDSRGWLDRALFGAAHERVVDEAPCAVFVTPAEAGPIQLERGRVARRWPAAMGGA